MCPNCKANLNCPCDNCKSEEPKWIWINGEDIKCPLCGYQANADIWQDFEYEQYELNKEVKK